MFTGIIKGIGRVTALSRTRKGATLTVRVPPGISLRKGDSLSVNGVCLTVNRKRGELVEFDLSQETLSVTTFLSLAEGDRVNLEPPLSASDSLGGHLVTGHVDGVGKVSKIKKEGEGVVMTFSLPKAFQKGIVYKGSIAVDGVSLTVAGLKNSSFRVALIPYTLTHTTLKERKVGDSVNLELDIIGKYVAQYLGRRRP